MDIETVTFLLTDNFGRAHVAITVPSSEVDVETLQKAGAVAESYSQNIKAVEVISTGSMGDLIRIIKEKNGE